MAMMRLRREDPRVVGSFRLHRRLGTGGMGVVYLGSDRRGQKVALKLIRPELAEDHEFRTRFAREVAAARRIRGGCTARVVAADIDADRPWLATAYVPGPSLYKKVMDVGPLPWAEIAGIGAALADGLVHVHAAGVVHRDLKPSNILLSPRGPRIIDFGIAWSTGASTLTHVGTAVGSPGFLAPEQVRGASVTSATDVFAFGSTLAYAATGDSPFGSGTSEVMLYRVVHEEPDLRGVPEPLAPLIRACLAKEPAERPRPIELHELLGALAERAATHRAHGTAGGAAAAASGSPHPPASAGPEQPERPSPQRPAGPAAGRHEGTGTPAYGTAESRTRREPAPRTPHPPQAAHPGAPAGHGAPAGPGLPSGGGRAGREGTDSARPPHSGLPRDTRSGRPGVQPTPARPDRSAPEQHPHDGRASQPHAPHPQSPAAAQSSRPEDGTHGRAGRNGRPGHAPGHAPQPAHGPGAGAEQRRPGAEGHSSARRTGTSGGAGIPGSAGGPGTGAAGTGAGRRGIEQQSGSRPRPAHPPADRHATGSPQSARPHGASASRAPGESEAGGGTGAGAGSARPPRRPGAAGASAAGGGSGSGSRKPGGPATPPGARGRQGAGRGPRSPREAQAHAEARSQGRRPAGRAGGGPGAARSGRAGARPGEGAARARLMRQRLIVFITVTVGVALAIAAARGWSHSRSAHGLGSPAGSVSPAHPSGSRNAAAGTVDVAAGGGSSDAIGAAASPAQLSALTGSGGATASGSASAGAAAGASGKAVGGPEVDWADRSYPDPAGGPPIRLVGGRSVGSAEPVSLTTVLAARYRGAPAAVVVLTRDIGGVPQDLIELYGFAGGRPLLAGSHASTGDAGAVGSWRIADGTVVREERVGGRTVSETRYSARGDGTMTESWPGGGGPGSRSPAATPTRTSSGGAARR